MQIKITWLVGIQIRADLSGSHPNPPVLHYFVQSSNGRPDMLTFWGVEAVHAHRLRSGRADDWLTSWWKCISGILGYLDPSWWPNIPHFCWLKVAGETYPVQELGVECHCMENRESWTASHYPKKTAYTDKVKISQEGPGGCPPAKVWWNAVHQSLEETEHCGYLNTW